MALIKLGSTITGISGHVGGQTFGMAGSGVYLRNTGLSKKGHTTLRSATLGLFSTLPGVWRNLTINQRLAWQTATANFPYINRLGEVKYYTGYILFMKLNGGLIQVEEPLQLNAPALFNFQPLAVAGSFSSNIEIFYQLQMSAGSQFARIFSSGPVSKGTTSAYRNFYHIADEVIQDTNFNFPMSEYLIDKFGSTVKGAKYFFYVNLFNIPDGQQLKKQGITSTVSLF